MTKGIGVLVSERITVGLIENNRLSGQIRSFPEDPEIDDALVGFPAEMIARQVAEQVLQLGGLEGVAYLGVGFPGIIRNNVIEDSPNLPQLKGSQIGQLLKDALGPHLSNMPVICFNDADIFAAGMAATRVVG